MNQKQAKKLRGISSSRMEYQEFKRAYLSKNTGQKPKPLATRKQKLKKSIPATWPRTDNQKAQSRPVIVIKPVRALKARLKDEALYGWQVRDLLDSVKNQPKHLLDLG
jgi:hypothetical protein